VDTGRIRISSQIPPATNQVPDLFPTPPSTDPTGDISFMEEITYLIQNRISEAFIRNKFKDWLWRFIRKAGSYEEMAYGETIVGPESGEEGYIIPGHGLVWVDEATRMRELSASQMRFEGWRGGISYVYLMKVTSQRNVEADAICRIGPLCFRRMWLRRWMCIIRLID
jgi:hypothetical protein